MRDSPFGELPLLITFEPRARPAVCPWRVGACTLCDLSSMAKKGKAQEFAEYAAVRALVSGLGVLPRGAAVRVGRALGLAAYKLAGGLRRTGMRNLELAFPDAEEAERIGRTVVEERLAACINILGPVRSVYRWQGEVQAADEVGAILKTSRDCADALITRIAGLHSYDVPCVVTWPIDKILAPYADWVEDSVG